MLGMDPVPPQPQAAANLGNAFRFNPICKYHKQAQKPDVLVKLLTAMNGIKNDLNNNAHGAAKHFFLSNHNGVRAVHLRRFTTVRSLCDYRRAVGYIEDRVMCDDTFAFASWPNPGDNGVRLGASCGETVYPAKFAEVVTSKAKADGFWDKTIE